MMNCHKDEESQDRKRRLWRRRFRKEMRAFDQHAEPILNSNTDFHSRLMQYRQALFASVRTVVAA